jgi:hypothetical protein
MTETSSGLILSPIKVKAICLCLITVSHDVSTYFSCSAWNIIEYIINFCYAGIMPVR